LQLCINANREITELSYTNKLRAAAGAAAFAFEKHLFNIGSGMYNDAQTFLAAAEEE